MDDTSSSRSLPTSLLYAAAIAIVSGSYSVLASTGGITMTAGSWVMLAVGAIALVHGIVLLTPAASRLGSWSGPLMIAYAVVMLLNRIALPMGGADGMGSGMMGGESVGGMMGGYLGTMGPAGGFGMTALAILMLLSGIIMTVRSDGDM